MTRSTSSVPIHESAEGDFVNLTQGASIQGGADEKQMDLWTGDPGDLLSVFGNDTDWILELWINESKTPGCHLHLTAHRYDGTNIFSTPDHYLGREFVLNASVWADEMTGPGLWEIYVVGTYEPAGVGTGAMGFVNKLTFEADMTFNETWELQEFQIDLTETWITDLKVDRLDFVALAEVVVCGYVLNATSYDAFVHVWTQVAVWGPLTSANTVTWSEDNAEIKPTALDIGQFDDSAPDGEKDLVVVGNHYTTTDVFGRIDLFSGTDYDEATGHGGWNTTMLNGVPTTSHIHDVVVCDADSDGVTQLYVVGDLVVYGFFAAINWLDGVINTEFYFTRDYGYDSACFYEVEIANITTWDSQEVIIYGKGHETATGDEYMILSVYNYTGVHLEGIVNITGTTAMDLIDHFAELRISDTDGNGRGEVILCASYIDETATRGRDDTVYLGSFEGAPYPAEPAGRYPTPPPADDVPSSRYPDHLDDDDEVAASETTTEYWLRWADENGWYILMTVVFGVIIWALAVLGLGWTPAKLRDPRYLLLTVGLVFLTIMQWPGIPIWEFWTTPRAWVWYRVTWLYDWMSSSIGSLLP